MGKDSNVSCYDYNRPLKEAVKASEKTLGIPPEKHTFFNHLDSVQGHMKKMGLTEDKLNEILNG